MRDDISAAFHQVRYHPNLGIIFSTVWGPYFVVSVLSNFGARNSPGNFHVKSEVWSHIAHHLPLKEPLLQVDLVEWLILSPEPDPPVTETFAITMPDEVNTGIGSPQDPFPE